MAEQSHKTFLCLILVRKHAERQNGTAAIIPGAKLGSIRDKVIELTVPRLSLDNIKY